MSATVLSFPQRASSPAPWHPQVTDFPFMGWASGATAACRSSRRWQKKFGAKAGLHPNIEGVGPVRSARLAHGRGGGVD
jgi:hypothetical protein